MKLSCAAKLSFAFLVSLFIVPATCAFAQTPSGDVVISTSTAWVAGSYQLNSLTVNSGATLTVAGGSTLTVSGAVVVTGNSNIVLQGANTTAQVNGAWAGMGVTLNAASIEVDAGSSINADGQGYAVWDGPGAPSGGNSSGGSYGGLGGGNSAAVYGSVTAPTDLGSGGGCYYCGNAGAGGGAITLTVSGTLTNNGIISANGGNANNGEGGAGGGSGGSVYITTGSLAGTGSIAANGGSGSSVNGGGGGRVAINYTTNGSFNLALATANGGSGGSGGAPGSVYLLGASKELTVSSGNTVLPANLNLTYDSVTVGDQSSLTLGSGTTLTANSISVSNGSTFIVGGGSTLNVSGQILVTGNSNMILQGANTTAQVNNLWAGVGVTVNAGSVEVDAGSSINADGQGYAGSGCNGPGSGPGGGQVNCDNAGNGGSYGGIGAGPNQSSMTTYGSAPAPTDLGSGGSGGYISPVGGSGGGAIRLVVSGALTNNGVVSANGSGGGNCSGAGSGGSVYVTTATLLGAGIFQANGGAAAGCSAGGGGGRIAVYYTSASGFSGFTGSTASGGTSAQVGTEIFADTSLANPKATVYQNYVLPANQVANYDSFTVTNGGNLTVSSGVQLNLTESLKVTGNSTVTVFSENNTVQVGGLWKGFGGTISAASVQVDSGSSITADGQGYVGSGCNGPGSGPGGGQVNCDNAGNGGSYGGVGGGPNQSTATTYGSAPTPTDLGSGGSGGYASPLGAAGGGAIRLMVSGTLTNNGVVSANGYGAGNCSGAGSGGSVYVTTATLAGAGVFQANGGAATGCNAGGGGGRIAVYYSSAAGYTGFAGSTVSGGTSAQAGTAIFADTSLANPKAYIYQNYVLPADSQTTYDSITVTNGANLTMGGGSQLTLTKSMTLSNNSTVTVLSKNNTGLVGGFWKGVGGTIQAANLQIDSGSSITADGQGYLGSGCSGPGDGPGGGQLNCDNSGNAGSYGGAGGGPNQATATTYGSANQPTDLGSGGSGGYASGAGQAGGGAIRLMVTGTLTNNGLVTANGIGVGGYAGAGSGGSIYATATTLAGTGVFQANGGGAPTSTTGGGGGRTAIYYYANNGFNQASATANGENSGQNGTVVFSNTPQFQWVTPASGVSVLHGSNTLSWSADAVNFSTYSVTLTISGPLAFTAGTNLSPLGSYQWDTTTAPDGRYDLRLVFYDANGNDIKELPRTVVVNNSVVWHSGTITANQEWTADKVQGLDGIVTIPSGVTVTIDPGTVVKALPGAQIVVQSGGILNALGGSSNPVIFTVFNDSSVGGDTDFSNGQSVPSPGEWNGISVQSGGVFNSNANTEILYVSSSQAGTLPTSETWMSNQLYVVTGNLIVPSGATLTLQPGTIVKFDAGAGITVQAGAQLLAQGTEAQPIYFTSLKDDSIGGDTNGDGDATSPAAGDWGSITISGTGASAAFNHVQIFYGGGPVSASYQLGMVETGSGATVTIDNSILAKSFWTGIWTGATGGGDTVTISNSLLYGISERAVNAWGGSIVHLVNDTFDNNAVAIMQHGGSIDMANSILTNCLGMNGWNACVQGSITAAYSDVWANQANIANYSTGDPTGTNGNISADPVYVNATQHDYRLNFGSPAIDAANGLAANYLTTDLMGDPRYNDPEVTTKAGVADANGNYPDMGAYEFVQSAASNVNLTVSAVNGPSTALTGSQVQLTWIDTNTGSGVAQGPWHDAIYLVRDPDTNPVAILAGEVLVASNVTLGPGASTTATGTIRVPGSIVGNHRWEVKANDRGEVFVGANAVNNTGISLDTVAIDLPELDLDAAASPASFSASGQSSWYKFTPGANQSVTLDLALNSINGSPSTGSVQLFVGQGYVPTPQHFDYQQVEWNSPTASTVVPNTSSQTYYVTAYAQSLPATPAAFTLAASTVHFSLTAVQPSTITIQPTSLVKPGPVTVTFMGGGFTSNATYQLVDANSKIYSASSVFVSDSTQASVTFAMADIPAGSYTAQVTEGSSTVSLTNALTVTAVSASTSGQQVQVNLVAPQEFRTGFPETVTLNYSNVSGADVPAPLIWLTATNATLSEIAPQCAGCSTNFTQQYNNTFTSGLVLGINSQGPAGVLPAGAQGSIQFQALPTGGEVTFTLKYINGVEAVNTWYGVIFQGYDADHAAAFCNTLLPSFDNALGFSRTCMQLLNNASYKFVPGNGEFSQPIPGGVAYFPDGGYLDVNGFNGLLAADATALSLAGTYESDATRILGFELQKDGLSIFNQRYHQGAFGYGKSHPFDITAQLSGGLPTVFSPNGSARVFPVQNPNQTGQYFGTVGDYGTLTIAADGSWMVTERNGVSKHFIADPVSNANSRHLLDFIQDLNGNRITLTYTNDLVSSVTDSVGNAISYTYDSLGHITQSTDPEGRITTYAYDIKSDRLNSTFLTSVTNASGTTTIAWNEGGPSGVGYFQDLCVTTYCEPAIGVSSITYPDKTHTYFTYDSLGRLTSKYRDGNTETESFTYDSTGAVTATDATGNAVRIAPDEEGGVAQFTDPLLAVTQFSYDAEHKLTRMEEPLGTGYSISYDTQGNPIALLDPLGNQTSMAYTSYGRLQSLTDPNGNATSYNYDSHSNRTAINYSDGSAEQFSYDSFGNLIKWTNRRGNSITFTYDAHNLLLTKTYASGAQISYTYDNHRNLLTATSSSGSTTFTYDSADRLTSVTYPNGKAIQYTYNSLGQRSSQQDSTGFTVNYSYDSVGRLAQLTNSTGAVIVTYTYNAAGRLATKTLGNGTHTTQAYDANGNLLHLIHYSAANAVLSEFDYTYDALGRRISATTPAGAWTYSYDADGQLTSVTLPSASAQYTYDANGNRLSAVTSGSASNYNVNNLNEYSAAGSSVYRYDADGNLVSGGGWTYTYDDENRLTAMANSTDTWSFQYDALGNRASSTHNGSVTQYLNDPSGSGNVEAEFDGSGNLLSHFTYGLGLTSMVPAGGAADYYHFDGSGNTAQLTNATGSIINSYTFLPFGEPIASTAGVANPFTYHAQSGAMDDGSGIYLLAGRWYSPQLGRFMQQSNSATTGGNSNPYTFAKNAPGKTPPIALGIPARDTGKATNQSKLSRPGSNGAVQKSATLDIQKNASKNGIGVCIGQDCPDNGDDGVIIEEVEPEDPPVDPPVIIAENPDDWPLDDDLDQLSDDLAWWDALSDLLDDETEQYTFEDLVKYGWTLGLKDVKDAWTWFNHDFDNDPLFDGQPEEDDDIPVGGSKDPNGKITSGFGDQGYIPTGVPITYTIYFENQSSATAPAQIVTVTDPLAANLDWSSVQLNQIEFNNVTITVPNGAQSYTGQVSVSTDPNPVNVTAALNPTTGVLGWKMQSVNPVTGGLPADPLAGFLPPNNASNQGTGFVTFSVMPKTGLANGATITNQASIVFDVNAAIATNTVTNTIDSVYPTSSVASLPAITTTTTFPVSWSGSDPAGAGIASYSIFVSVNSGYYSLWLPSTTATSSTYTGALGTTYSFYSMATDNVGLSQQAAGQVQTISVMGSPTVTVKPNPSSISAAQALTVTVSVAGGSGNPTPTGSVTLSGGGYTSTAQPLSGGSFVFTVPANSLSAGIDTLTASYNGDTNYTSMTGTATVTVAAVPLTPTVTVSPKASTTDTGSSLSVPVTVTGAGAMPTGTVTLAAGSYTSTAEPLTSGAYTFTIPANSLSAPSATITVTYSGDAIYATNTGTASVTVTASIFSLAATTPVAVAPGSPATSTITVSTTTEYAGSVTVACALTSSPANATDLPTCSAGSSTVNLSSAAPTGTTTVTVTTTGSGSASLRPVTGRWAGGAALALLLFLGIPARRRGWSAMLGLLLLLAAMGTVSGCGGSSSSSGQTGTTAGNYTFTVTGTGSPSVSPAPTTTFTLTVN